MSINEYIEKIGTIISENVITFKNGCKVIINRECKERYSVYVYGNGCINKYGANKGMLHIRTWRIDCVRNNQKNTSRSVIL